MEISVKTIILAVIIIMLIMAVFLFGDDLREFFTKLANRDLVAAQIAFQNLPQAEKIKTYYLAQIKKELSEIKKTVAQEERRTAQLLTEAKRKLVTPIMPPPPTERETKTYTVKILSGTKAEPANLTIFVGDTVTFVNADSELRWPAANPYPTSSALPDFNAVGGIGVRENYSFTFFIPGTFGYHDRLLKDPPTIGFITVLP